MKVSKALKEKNKLAGEVSKLKVLLSGNNVTPSNRKPVYDTKKVHQELLDKVAELIAVKTKIAAANVAVYNKIFGLAELKGLLATLKTVDTKSGVFKEGGGYGKDPYDIEYVAQISRVELDEMIQEVEKRIEVLQEELDQFNFTTDV